MTTKKVEKFTEDEYFVKSKKFKKMVIISLIVFVIIYLVMNNMNYECGGEEIKNFDFSGMPYDIVYVTY